MSGDALLQMLRSIAQLLAQLEELGPGVGEAPSVTELVQNIYMQLSHTHLHTHVVSLTQLSF